MSRPLCGCRDARSCNCFNPATHQAPQQYYQQFSPPLTPQPQWPQQYSYSLPHGPSLAPWAPIPQNFQASNYQHTFQSPPRNEPLPSDPPAFRVALGESTSNTLNEPPSQTGTKRKRTTGTSARARKRRTATATSDLHTPSQTAIPAVAGVGPVTDEDASTSESGPSLHPAFTQTQGPSTTLGSLLSKRGSKTQGASDVWYFTQGIHSIVRPDTRPEKEILSEKQPNPKEYSHLACRLCTYVIENQCRIQFDADDTQVVTTGPLGKTRLARLQLFGITSSSNMVNTGATLYCCSS